MSEHDGAASLVRSDALLTDLVESIMEQAENQMTQAENEQSAGEKDASLTSLAAARALRYMARAVRNTANGKDDMAARRNVTCQSAGSVYQWPEIKCGNNRCPWRGMWNDLPQRSQNTPDNGKKTLPMTVGVCPLCGSAEFWEIDPPNASHEAERRSEADE